MIVAAFDIALAHTGWAVLGREIVIGYGVIETAPRNKDTETQGQADFRRVTKLRRELSRVIGDCITDLSASGRDADELIVAMERTDWIAGGGSSRIGLVRDAEAREALAMGATTLYCVCEDHHVQPLAIGPNEWHREFGARDKDDVAVVVARTYPNQFSVAWRERRNKHLKCGMEQYQAAVDRATEADVPDHVTDAIALGYVIQHKTEYSVRIQASEV